MIFFREKGCESPLILKIKGLKIGITELKRGVYRLVVCAKVEVVL